MVNVFRAMTLAFCGMCLLGCSGSERDTAATTAEKSNEENSTVSAPVVSQDDSVVLQDNHVAEDGRSRPTNRLARETSPYLLLHAHNPVDWYPWGPEAFETAKREDKPIFLSIGYSSCYWCHVMERLVFEDEQIAEYMNEHFVNIKVDREERPDVDDIYMTALLVYLQAVRSPQGGGWPLSIFLTPEGKPIAGGTYFPPEDAPGRMGFPKVMSTVVEVWTNQRETVESTADLLVKEVRRLSKPTFSLKPADLERGLFTQTVVALLDSYDAKHGGIEFDAANPDAPKFPVPSKIACLQYELRQNGNADAAEAVYHTLNRLATGGIRDHLGGGFHRYSTDRYWHVPHFEKMLYDQAQLADVYVEAFLQTNNPDYAAVAGGIFDFVLREMTGPKGGFYSALDAETDGIEGKRYVWEPEEIRKVLGGDAELFSRVYGLNEPQAFEHGYVLHLPQPIDKAAEELGMPASELKQQLTGMRERLFAVREQRKPLLKDDKVLTSWNGLMITALAHGGKVLRRSDLIESAQDAAMLILTSMRDENGRLHRTYRAEQATLNAYLDDYAFLVEGLLALYETTGDRKWLNAAQRLTDDQIELFWDEQGRGFFFTSHHHEELLARTKNAHDAVLPSGNSVSVRNLIRLSKLTRDEKYLDYARQTLQVFATELSQRPRAMSNMALALSEFLDAAGEHPSAAESPGSSAEESIVEGPIVQIAAEKTAGDPQNREKVTAKAYLSVDRLPAGKSCRIVVLLDIEQGWHINANPPQPDFLTATTFTLKSKHGTQLGKVTYPKPHELVIEGFDQPLLVYEGRVAIYGVVNVPAEAGDSNEEIELTVQYQACNDQNCIRPTHVTLRGRVPVAAAGQPVKRINGKLFPKLQSR